MPEKFKYVIIGAGPAGISACKSIRSIDGTGSILLISKSHPHSQIFLTDILFSPDRENEIKRDLNLFKVLGIETLFGERVVNIEPENNVLALENKKIIFEKLLLSTGSIPALPRLKGVEEILTFVSLEDAVKLREILVSVRKVAIVGAGAIGIELAYALSKKGFYVQLIELMDRLLPAVLDKKFSEILEKYLKCKGVELFLGRSVSEIKQDEGYKILLSDGTTLSADVVVFATGVKPNISLAKKANLLTNVGIIVNEYFETSKKNVYAAGDVAESYNFLKKREISYSWFRACEHGRIAGYNMAGKKVEYKGDVKGIFIKDIEMPLVSVGLTPIDIEKSDIDYVEITYLKGDIRRTAYFSDDKLVGFVSIGSNRDLASAGILRKIIRFGSKIKDKNRFIKNPFIYLAKKIWNYL